jgi:YidC/Oxa1 family membrane protein insertase
MRAALDLKSFMKEKNISMLKMFAPMASMPFFIIFFIALRRMASEYESFQWGGISWFTDLSVADPYMVLPVISALGMVASFEVAQSNKLPSQNAQVQSQVMLKYMRWFMRGMAAISILITKNMPTVCLFYNN